MINTAGPALRPQFGYPQQVATPASAPASPAGREDTKLYSIALGLLLVEVFVNVSRVLEILQFDFGLNVPYLGSALEILTILVALMTGGFKRLVMSVPGAFLIFFTFWMLLCTPLSTWRGGSVQMILHSWLPALMTFFIAGIATTLRQCRQMATTIGVGAVAVALASFFLGDLKQGRFEFHEGTLGNANDLAAILLLGLPFVAALILGSKTTFISRVAAGGGCLVCIWVILRTGSRQALVTLVAMFIILVWLRRGPAKWRLLTAGVVVAVVFGAVLDSHTVGRFATLVTTSEKDKTQADAYGSTRARQELMNESLGVTMRNPIFGVGPGVYMAATASAAEREGRRATWAVSHNAYTQVSSEMGIPGLALYLGGIIVTFANIFWIRRYSRQDKTGIVGTLSIALLLSLSGVCIDFMFNSSAYLGTLPTLMGLTAALRFACQRQLDRPAAAVHVPAASQRTSPAGLSPVRMAAAPATVPASKPTPAPSYRFLGRPRRVRPGVS